MRPDELFRPFVDADCFLLEGHIWSQRLKQLFACFHFRESTMVRPDNAVTGQLPINGIHMCGEATADNHAQ